MDRNLLDPFIEKIPLAGCWIWLRALDKDGYGYAYDGFKVRKAHRLFYELYIGDIPPGLYILHRCDVRCCVMPDHLYAGTQSDNVEDMLRRFPNRTHCSRGHELIGDNLDDSDGIRRCRVCRHDALDRRLNKLSKDLDGSGE